LCSATRFNICKETGVKLDTEQCVSTYVPKSVEPSRESKVSFLCSQQVKNDRTIPNNKPDIIVRDNEKGTYMFLDVVISEIEI